MPRITIEAVYGDSGPRRWTLRERIVADNLDSDHYVDQLIERLSWATADAEDLEARSSDIGEHDPTVARRSRRATTTRRDSPRERSRPRRKPGPDRATA